MRTELQRLVRAERPPIVAALAAAAAEGDRSENAEYQYRKKQLRELDRRIGYLDRRLPVLRIVEPSSRRDAVFFGVPFELTRRPTTALNPADGQDSASPEKPLPALTPALESLWLTIVGPDEADAATGRISVDAPLAKAVLGKALGALIDVQLPDRTDGYAVSRIGARDP